MEVEMRTVAIAALLVACTGDGGDATSETGTPGTPGTGCQAEPMQLTLGTGVTSYSPLSPLDELTVVHGPQGGWHIDTAGLLGNTGNEVSIMPTFTRSGGEVVAGGPEQNAAFTALVGYDEASCTGEFFGIRAFVPDSFTQTDVCTFEGETLEMCLMVQDLANGQSVTECTDIVARTDEADGC